jgi:hypothetical protein
LILVLVSYLFLYYNHFICLLIFLYFYFKAFLRDCAAPQLPTGLVFQALANALYSALEKALPKSGGGGEGEEEGGSGVWALLCYLRHNF